jgi:hypothetical protein
VNRLRDGAKENTGTLKPVGVCRAERCDIMSKKEILEELKKLAPAERLVVIEAALKELRGETQQTEPPSTKGDTKKKLAAAAEALFADYAGDGELTAFSVLDGEDFHA